METKQTTLTETLTEERIREVGEKIAGLPDGEEFEENVEDDLWQKFVGDDNLEENESVEWDDLPDESKSVIGYMDKDGTEVPWWLESFRWEVKSRGETIDNLGPNLSDLPNFDQTATKIHKPELADDKITKVLNSFSQLGETIDKNVGIEQKQDYSLPSEVFEITGETVRTTEDFRNWFESLLGLCPPFNEVLTSLVMVNSNVKVEAVEGVVPDELLATLEDIGVIDDSDTRIYESGYHEPITSGSLNWDAILTTESIFDCTLPSDVDSLELLFYRNWAENYDGDKERMSEWIEKASKTVPDSLETGEHKKFGLVALNAPLLLSVGDSAPDDKVKYTTLGLYAKSTNKSGYYEGQTQRRRRKIDQIMRSTDLLQE